MGVEFNKIWWSDGQYWHEKINQESHQRTGRFRHSVGSVDVWGHGSLLPNFVLEKTCLWRITPP